TDASFPLVLEISATRGSPPRGRPVDCALGRRLGTSADVPKIGAMPRANERVEALLQEYADLRAISGGDPFRSRSYEKAARSIGGYHEDISGMDLKGLQGIPNVGKSIAEKVQEYLETGAIQDVEDLRAKIPPGVLEMMSISGLGPKKAWVLYQEL